MWTVLSQQSELLIKVWRHVYKNNLSVHFHPGIVVLSLSPSHPRDRYQQRFNLLIKKAPFRLLRSPRSPASPAKRNFRGERHKVCNGIFFLSPPPHHGVEATPKMMILIIVFDRLLRVPQLTFQLFFFFCVFCSVVFHRCSLRDFFFIRLLHINKIYEKKNNIYSSSGSSATKMREFESNLETGVSLQVDIIWLWVPLIKMRKQR